MGEEERHERRSMVGVPPTVRKPPPAARPPRTPRVSALRQSAKRKHEDESEEERESGSERQDSEMGDNEEDSGTEETTGSETPGKPKKKARRRAHLTDYSARRKQREKEKEKLRKAGMLEEPATPAPAEQEEKKPTPPPETPEPVIKTPSVKKYSPLQLMADHLLRKVMSKDPEEYFAFPVTPSMAPDYHTIIAHPMDFSTMRQKIEDDAYQNITEMRTDAELIVSNALTYNNPNTVQIFHFTLKLCFPINHFF
ncbi:Bromodomain protein [Oesophagostomum dentatum]|uniref:Bromodomain protein n=1 Tax=Oesophagostomum dentatum TaxID=61180 RepID=A0A0B1THR2_OESDE|nr:Bromodomain protein [Oesophagostomum dentatum]